MLSQSQHVNIQVLVRGVYRLEILSGEMLQPEHERTTRNGFLDDRRVHGKLVSNRRANQVSSVRIKAFFDQKIDLPEIHGAKVDRDFFRVAAFGTRRVG